MTIETAQTEEAQLWQAFRGGADAGARERLVLLHQDFARIMAAKLYARRYTDEVEFGDYLQFALVGLLESVDRYDPGYGASFRTYASHRIQGAVLSGLESLTERSRQTALRQRAQQERVRSLAAAEEGAADDAFIRLASVAVGLAVGFMLDDVSAYQPQEGTYGDNAYTAVAARQTRQRLMHLVERLPPREARVIRHHYLQQVSFDEIAKAMELTPGRISQLHRRALGLLREAMKAEGLDLVL